jgi:hypothetical protein
MTSYATAEPDAERPALTMMKVNFRHIAPLNDRDHDLPVPRRAGRGRAVKKA